jgi:hypothetical protein
MQREASNVLSITALILFITAVMVVALAAG